MFAGRVERCSRSARREDDCLRAVLKAEFCRVMSGV